MSQLDDTPTVTLFDPIVKQKEYLALVEKFLNTFQAVLRGARFLPEFFDQLKKTQCRLGHKKFPFFAGIRLGGDPLMAISGDDIDVYQVVRFPYDSNLCISIALRKSGAISLIRENASIVGGLSGYFTWYECLFQTYESRSKDGRISIHEDNPPIPATLLGFIEFMTPEGVFPKELGSAKFDEGKIRAFLKYTFDGTIAERIRR